MNTNLALGFLYSGDIWDEDTPYELHDVGYEMLAELKGKDLVEVTRCKDCKNFKLLKTSTKFGFCKYCKYYCDVSGFCDRAERKESDE